MFHSFDDIRHLFSRLSRQLVPQYCPGPGQERPTVAPFEDGQEVDALKEGLGDRALGVAEARGADERERDRVVAQGGQDGRLLGRRAGEEVARVIEHDGLPAGGSHCLELRLFVQPGDRYLERGEAVRPDAEEGKRRLAPIDRRLSPGEPIGVLLQIIPEAGARRARGVVSSPIRFWVTSTARSVRSPAARFRSVPLIKG